MLKLLITGAHGFVSRSIADAAINRRMEVLGLGRGNTPPLHWPGAYFGGQIASETEQTLRHFAPDIIFHGAGSASVGQSFITPFDDFRAAVETFAMMLEGVRRSAKQPVILFPSSAAVYGAPEILPMAEEAAVNPMSPYGFHKLQAELIAQEYATCFGLNIVVCRLFSLYGARQRRLLIWEIFNQLRAAGDTLVLNGTGRESRDYLQIDDACDAILALGEMSLRHASGAGRCEVVNVASGTEISVCDVVSILQEILGTAKPVITNIDHRHGDPIHWRADISKLNRLLGNRTRQELPPGLRACTHAWSE